MRFNLELASEVERVAAHVNIIRRHRRVTAARQLPDSELIHPGFERRAVIRRQNGEIEVFGSIAHGRVYNTISELYPLHSAARFILPQLVCAPPAL